MTDGLKPQYRRAIIETLSANPKVERVVLFGSRAMGTFTPTSDIDLALFGDDLTLSDQAALTEAMAELAIPQRVDILIHHRVENQALREHIRKHGVEWFARKRATGKLATAELRPSCASNKRKAPTSTPPSAPTARSSGMTGEWRETTLGELVDFLSGGTPSKARADYWAGSVPWVSAKDMKRFRLDDAEDHISEEAIVNGTGLVPAGSVLLLTRGMTPLNDVPICVIDRPMTFNQDVKALWPKPRVCADYLPYLLLGNKERLLSLVDLAGHGTGRLNSDELKALDIMLPPLPEQRAIAHILGTLDDRSS